MRAYAVFEAPPARGVPRDEPERVRLTHPRRVPTDRRPLTIGLGPRNPDQRVWPLPPPPALDFPDGKPSTARQRIIVNPEALARRLAERRAKGQTGGEEDGT